ncbi:MAG: Minf_1886 family protein [Planctomycetota bacterium]
MRAKPDFDDAILKIVRKDPRFRPAAYFFMFEALDYVAAKMETPRHVTGQELLAGIRNLARIRFGFLAKTVFDRWGIHRTADFGAIVFHLVDAGLMGRTDSDTAADFEDGYDFTEAFEQGYDFGIRHAPRAKKQARAETHGAGEPPPGSIQ